MSIAGIEHAVNVAVYSRLTVNAALMAIVSGVYDEVPQPPTYPYIQIGESIASKAATFGADGRDVLCTLHVWSRYAGMAQTSDIIGRVADLLDEYALTVSGGVVESCEVEASRVMRDPDGITRHGVIDLRVRVAAS